MYVFNNSLEKSIFMNLKSFYLVDSSAHYFKFNVTPCSMLNKSVWHAAVTWIPSESL